MVRPRRRAVLAFLLLHADRQVRSEQLIDAIWGDEPPRTARAQVHTAVSALRAGLPAPLAERLVSEPSGYRLATAEGELDLAEFRRRTAAARVLAGTDRDAEAVPLLRSALGLWRGPAMADVAAPFVEAARVRLEEERFSSYELLADLEMGAGRHAELVPELTALADEYPARESIARRLALALYRSGRRTDALTVLRGLAELLAHDYGLDPAPEVRELESRLLRDDPSLAGPPKRPVPGGRTPPAAAPRRARPAQLPRPTMGFVGRGADLAKLSRLLSDDNGGAGAEPARIAVVSGPAGVGKTALVLQWAHACADAFPDGQLFVDLHGYDRADSETPGGVLERFLMALGVPGYQIPADLSQREDLYRSCVADRKMLLVLDNAHSYQQVRPLLPGSLQCRTVVTGRGRLGELLAQTGGVPVPLGMLPIEESVEVLARTAGQDRVKDAPDAARDLARLCGGLPLALRISAVRLLQEPQTPVADLAAELSAEEARLAGLSLPEGNYTVAHALDHTRQRLTAEQARLFHLMCLHPGDSVTVAAAEALSGTGDLRPSASPALRLALRALQEVYLLDQADPDRYVLHDLVRIYGQQSSPLPRDAARAALTRMTDWYIGVARAGQRLLEPSRPQLPADLVHRMSGPPPFATEQDAVGWFDQEAGTYIALIRWATAEGDDRAVWQLASAVSTYLKRRHRLDALTDTQRLGEQAAVRLGNELAAAACANDLGIACSLRRDPQGRAAYERAIAIYSRHGERERAANVRMNLGSLQYELGLLAEAAEIQRTAAVELREFGRTEMLAAALSNLGLTRSDLGDHRDARRLLSEAVAIVEECGSPYRIGNTYAVMGLVLLRLGDFDEGLRVSGRALVHARRTGDSLLTGRLLDQTGLALAAKGSWQEARQAWQEAVDVLSSVDSPEAHVVHARLSGESQALPVTGADGRPSLAHLPSR